MVAGERLVVISIHPPRGGRDLIHTVLRIFGYQFQSTLPVGGGTGIKAAIRRALVNFNPPSPWGEGLVQDRIRGSTHSISIHPPRGGRDGAGHGRRKPPHHFNPPSPWGEGPTSEIVLYIFGEFQSTLPVGGGTAGGDILDIDVTISIHPPRGGRDAVCLMSS